MGFHLSALKEDICSLRSQLRQASLGHWQGALSLGKPYADQRGFHVGPHFAPRPGHTLMCAHIGHAGQNDPGRQHSDHLMLALFS